MHRLNAERWRGERGEREMGKVNGVWGREERMEGRLKEEGRRERDREAVLRVKTERGCGIKRDGSVLLCVKKRES